MEQLDDWEDVSEEAGEWDEGLVANTTALAAAEAPAEPLLIASSGLCVPSLGFPAETEQAGNDDPPEAAKPAAAANMRPGMLLLPLPPAELDLLFS